MQESKQESLKSCHSSRKWRKIYQEYPPLNAFYKRSGVVVMSPGSEGLGATVEADVDSNLGQPSGISYFSHLCLYEIGFLPIWETRTSHDHLTARMWETSISHDHVTAGNNPLKGGRKRIHHESVHAE